MENKIVTTTKPKRIKMLSPSKRIHNYNIFIGTIFYGKMKLEIIFYWIGWTSYKFELLVVFKFYF